MGTGDNSEISVEAENALPFEPNQPTPAGSWKYIRVFSWCLLIFILSVNFGYELNLLGNLIAMPQFLRHFGEEVHGSLILSSKDQQILNAAPSIGLFFSAFSAGIISDKIGRRYSLITASAICCCGILIQFFSKDIMMLFGGKLVSTFGFGLGNFVAPVFVSEIAPDAIRGICLALINSMIVVGQWTASLTVYGWKFYSTADAWRFPLICQIIFPGVLILIGASILPESPTWLMMRNRPEDARKALLKFWGSSTGPDVDLALEKVHAAIESEEARSESRSSWVECFRQPNLRRTIIIVVVYASQQFIGINFVAGYLTYYFTLAGVQNPIGIGQAAYAMQMLGNICSWPLIERVGRRRLIVGGCIFMTANLLTIGGVSTIKTAPALKATVSLMAIWGFVYQATLGPAAYAVGGETANPRLRQKTYGINMMSTTLWATLVNELIPILINTNAANLGGKIAFVFFAPSVPVCIFLYFYFPEMGGRSVTELEEMFEMRLPARKFRGYKAPALENSILVEGEKEKSSVDA